MCYSVLSSPVPAPFFKSSSSCDCCGILRWCIKSSSPFFLYGGSFYCYIITHIISLNLLPFFHPKYSFFSSNSYTLFGLLISLPIFNPFSIVLLEVFLKLQFDHDLQLLFSTVIYSSNTSEHLEYVFPQDLYGLLPTRIEVSRGPGVWPCVRIYHCVEQAKIAALMEMIYLCQPNQLHFVHCSTLTPACTLSFSFFYNCTTCLLCLGLPAHSPFPN